MTFEQPIAEDVREGLRAHPKRLPPRLFYDAAGSVLFEQITRAPEYYLTRTELEIFRNHAEEIVFAAGSPNAVIELGAGSAEKTSILLRELCRRRPELVFYPIDVSATALRLARQRLAQEHPALRVEPMRGRYRASMTRLSSVPGPKLVLFIGSSLGNYEPCDASDLLRDLRETLPQGDQVLLGVDLHKDRSILLPAYDDARGITAQFNKNILARINRELGGHFDLSLFRHVALWNEKASRVEMHLESTCAQAVEIDDLEVRCDLDQGERIHTECSYKFTPAMLTQLFSESGWSLVQSWLDSRRWFSVCLLQ